MFAEPPLLTFVIPCLNEAATISSVVRDCYRGGEQCKCSFEIIVADNGSSDGSQLIAESLGAHVINVTERGYGSALLAGFKAAQGEYIIMGDADSTYEFFRAAEFIYELRSGYQLVMGNRFKGEIASGAMPFLHRYLGNPVLSTLGRIFFGINISDFHCGLRAFNRDAILSLNLNSKGMEFATEMVIKSSLAELQITEVPANLRPNPPNRTPHLNTWRDGWRHLKYMLSFSPKYSFIPVSVFLFIVSFLLISAYLAQAYIFTGPNTLVFGITFFVAGALMISDYILTREMLYYQYSVRKTYLSRHIDRFLGLQRGTDRLFKVSLLSFVFSLFSLFVLCVLTYFGISSVPAAGIAGASTCILILTSAFLYLLAAKISAYRSIHKTTSTE